MCKMKKSSCANSKFCWLYIVIGASTVITWLQAVCYMLQWRVSGSHLFGQTRVEFGAVLEVLLVEVQNGALVDDRLTLHGLRPSGLRGHTAQCCRHILVPI